ncbi:TIGR01777 family oxidoreductase [Pseudoclavibacter sp. 13-3]|uniref:TIGR01777 family oxidoreductase n=1 Tax=Pseudoclavibacter sp. 13-3 TaxID=2901228 RepID=UPI001E4DB423|nr:TIGR01777 family oxidoreductase [Pseudoclavibacter sp. 13-3]MCD7101062.1 TIGR01777 family oxidoreductase [Pseudoclavibacter sp. 13-3]
MKVLIAGASGLIGSEIRQQLTDTGHEVGVLTRPGSRPRPDSTLSWQWQPAAGELDPAAIEWADAIVSLNGTSIAKLPWTRSRRHGILTSRIESTRTLARAIAASAAPPKAWVSASAVGFYGSRPGERLTEQADAGEGFLAEVTRRWEAATNAATESTRVAHARTGIVLSTRAALGPLVALAKFGLAGRLGSGRQHWPWVSLRDEAAAYVHLATASEIAGPANIAAPSGATSEQVTRAVTRALRRPHVLPAPAWALRAVLGAAADDLLLADQQVVPERLTGEGFVFGDDDLNRAVREAVSMS